MFAGGRSAGWVGLEVDSCSGPFFLCDGRSHMHSSPAAEVLQIMRLIELNVRDGGITAETVDGSLCLFRPVLDRQTTATYGMSSAVNTFRRGSCFRRVYCVEQSARGRQLVKFSVQLKDENDRLLGSWDLDFKHGLHTHPVVGGVKGSAHIPYSGGLAALVLEIASLIKEGVTVEANQALEPAPSLDP